MIIGREDVTVIQTEVKKDEKSTKAQDMLSIFLHEKEGEAQCKKQVALAGREHDAAHQVLRQSESLHSIAVTKHEKLLSELRLKSMAVEIIRSAWLSAKREISPAYEEPSSPVEENVTLPVVSPEKKK